MGAFYAPVPPASSKAAGQAAAYRAARDSGASHSVSQSTLSWFSSLRASVTGDGQWNYEEAARGGGRHVDLFAFEYPTQPPFVFMSPVILEGHRPVHDPHVAYTAHHILRDACASRGTAVRVMDVGAAVGNFAGQFAALGCSVIAIEPRHIANLYVNLTKIANGWTDSRLWVAQRLLGDSVGIKEVYNSFLRWSFKQQPRDQHGDWTMQFLKMDTLAGINDEHPDGPNEPCFFMKMDIDGFEVRALLGTLNVTGGRTPFLCDQYVVEFTPGDWELSGTTHDEARYLFSTLETLGYGFRVCNDHVWAFHNNRREHPRTTGWFEALPAALWTEHSADATFERAINPGDTGKIEVWIYRKETERVRLQLAAQNSSGVTKVT